MRWTTLGVTTRKMRYGLSRCLKMCGTPTPGTPGRQLAGMDGVRGEALTRLHRYLSRFPVPPGVLPADGHEAA